MATPLEVTAARRGKECVDDFAVAGQIGVGRRDYRPLTPATAEARKLACRVRRSAHDRSNLVEGTANMSGSTNESRSAGASPTASARRAATTNTMRRTSSSSKPVSERQDPRTRFAKDLIEPLRVTPGKDVELGRNFDPDYVAKLDRSQAEDLLAQGVEALADFQERLAAQNVYGVLLVLQGIDGSGKDGTVKHVMSGVNPQGVEVHSFKQPSTEELDHDFLWRYQRALPERGRIGIFNRSHYEEVLVVRVHPDLLAAQRLPDAAPGTGTWKRRYRAINDWEHYLVANGIIVVKVFLNLSKEEQARRFLARIDRPEKNWKFSIGDIREREHWDDYQVAFSEMLSHTSTEAAPWYVVPADHKWFTHLATAAVLVHTLAAINPQYPTVDPAARNDMLQARAGLLAELGEN